MRSVTFILKTSNNEKENRIGGIVHDSNLFPHFSSK